MKTNFSTCRRPYRSMDDIRRAKIILRMMVVLACCVAAGVITLLSPGKSQALPSIAAHFGLGGNCAACHTSSSGGTTLTPDGNAREQLLVAMANPTQHSPEPVNFGVVHVGDSPLKFVAIGNSAPPGTQTFSDPGFGTVTLPLGESLHASITNPTTGVFASGAVDVAPGTSNNSALQVGLDTSSAGVRNGTAIIQLSSSGFPSAVGLSTGRGPVTEGIQIVNVQGQVNNFANPVLQLQNGSATLTRSGLVYTVNFGTIMSNTSVALHLVNSGPAVFTDLLNGQFLLPSSSRAHFTGFGSFSDLGGGSSVNNLLASVDVTGALGSFDDRITLTSTGHNPNFSQALPPITLDFVGNVVSGTPPPGGETPPPSGGTPAVPEPSTVILFASGLMGLAAYRLRR